MNAIRHSPRLIRKAGLTTISSESRMRPAAVAANASRLVQADSPHSSFVCHGDRIHDSLPASLLFFPFRNLGLGIVAVAIATMLLFFAHFVMTDLDNPFEGAWNVDSKPFNDLAMKYR